MDKMLTWSYKVKPREVPKIWPISETGKANILKVRVDFFRLILLYDFDVGLLIRICLPKLSSSICSEFCPVLH